MGKVFKIKVSKDGIISLHIFRHSHSHGNVHTASLPWKILTHTHTEREGRGGRGRVLFLWSDCTRSRKELLLRTVWIALADSVGCCWESIRREYVACGIIKDNQEVTRVLRHFCSSRNIPLIRCYHTRTL